MNKIENYEIVILQQQKIFLQLISSAIKECEIPKRLEKIKEATEFAVHSSTACFRSPELEEALVEIAEGITADLSVVFEADSVLHVMTECYDTGGHTRVVERWIENSSCLEKHSLLFTAKEKQKIPERLRRAVECHKGKIVCLPDSMTFVEKGKRLREIAAAMERVVLHVHPQDLIPILAFGCSDFHRPVYFFNHADHKFWLGGCIADIVVEFRTWGKTVTQQRRGIDRSFILGLPVDVTHARPTVNCEMVPRKSEAGSGKTILTVGSSHKYKPVGDWNFFRVAQRILDRYADCRIVAVGLEYRYCPEAKTLNKTSRGRFAAIGRIGYDELKKYYRQSNLVLDSFPMSGGVALMDAVSYGIPVLSLACPTGQLDYLVASSAFCQNEEELLKKVDLFLTDEEKARSCLLDVQKHLCEETDSAVWNIKIQRLYSLTGNHNIHRDGNTENAVSNLDVYLLSEAMKQKIKLRIPYVFTLYREIRMGKRMLKWRFFE